ncbi:MAG: hypothetical protein ED556_02035 [Winogradskyella sp.]|uniref:DUF6090 family protein n=1 Tax=Winogradskyella sp. TaxID=1883156 RepID=UPI000F3E71ED|nr:DUF6090 family protein [Winogradskyella sp.]RNC87992.1 MAG: hypothetical protein ED556_02035 [Winogradskyella sp.]
MIKFFRHIRKSLLEKNQMGKYFKYAIGEILLVVIGILIALQINNWNENRKERIYETKILSEIRKDLLLDSIYFNALKSRAKITLRGVNELRAINTSGDFISDSICSSYSRLGIGVNYSYRNGSYESLKSVGLDRISNDSLRNQISKIYDFTFPRNKELVYNIQNSRDDKYLKTFEEFFYYDINTKGNVITKPKLKISGEDIYRSLSFTTTIVFTESYAEELLIRLNIVLGHISDLLLNLDKELNSND